MVRWAKISEEIAEDLTIADMLSKPREARAALLFLMSLPRSDLYGILPGHPRLFKARVCPVSRISHATIEKLLALLIERRMFTSFTNNGKAYLLVTNYHKYQVVRWNNWVGPPAVRLPDQWEVPEGLIAFVRGLPPEKCCPFIEKIPALSQFLPESTVDYCSLQTTTDVVAVAVAVTDVDVDKGTKTTTRADSSAAPVEKKLTATQQIIEDVWQAFGFDDKPGGKGYSGLADLVQQHGIPMIEKWATTIKLAPPQVPKGAARWKWFCKEFRKAMNQPWTWDKLRDKQDDAREFWNDRS